MTWYSWPTGHLNISNLKFQASNKLLEICAQCCFFQNEIRTIC